MNGVLVVDKPQGPTSFDVVRRVGRALKTKKAGHTGTLDPMATGVLAICLGDATRIAQFIIDGDKAYDAVLKLGVTTDTLDAEGKVTRERPVPPLTAAGLEALLAEFRGPLMQTPPMYSAVKVDGKRLHELARQGVEVPREARPVTVHDLRLLDFSQDTLRLSMRVSKGFFVRVLAEELGERLGCGAHLTALRRTASGVFTIDQAIPLEVLERDGAAVAEGRLVGDNEALRTIDAVTVTEAESQRVRHGGALELARPDGLVRLLAPDGRLLALAQVDRGTVRYKRVLTTDA